jgi:hypothetical protein
VGVRAAALAGDGVDGLDVVGAHLVETLVGEGDDLVLADAGLERLEDILVDAVDHGRRHVEQRELVLALEHARFEQNLLAVTHLDPERLERKEKRRLHDVDSERQVAHALGLEDVADLLRRLLEEPCLRRHRAAQADQSRQRLLLRDPRRVELVVPRGGAEVPHPRLAVAGQQTPARELVPGPLADHGAREIADVVLIEDEHGTEARAREGLAGAREAVGVQPPEVDALLEVDLHVAGRLERTVPAVPRIDLIDARRWRRRLAGHGVGRRLRAAARSRSSSTTRCASASRSAITACS